MQNIVAGMPPGHSQINNDSFEPTSPISNSSQGSSTWDVYTSESHIFQGTQDWKYSSLRAKLGRHILVQGVRHRRYDQINLYVDPKIQNTVVRHDCLGKVAGWLFTPGAAYDIKWIIFNHTFILPRVEFVENPTLDVDGIFGYDFVEEFNHFFFRAWPMGSVQPSRFCIANPLFHPINVDQILKVYTAVRVEDSVIGVGVFFGPEAGLNTWIPHFDSEYRVAKSTVWGVVELAELDAFSTIISTVLKVSGDGQYIRVQFHTSSQKLISLGQTVGLSPENAELFANHFELIMRFLDLRKKFSVRANAVESDSIHILPYLDGISAEQAQRLAEVGVKSSLESDSSLKNSNDFYIKFLSGFKVARVPKTLVKETFKAMFKDCQKDDRGGMGCGVLNESFKFGRDEDSSHKLSIDGGRALPEQEKSIHSSLVGGKENEILDKGRTIHAEEIGAGYEVGADKICSAGKEIMHGPEIKKLEANITSSSLPSKLRGIAHIQSVPDMSRIDSEVKQQHMAQTKVFHLSPKDAEGNALGTADILIANAHIMRWKVRQSALREAAAMLNDSYKNASKIREFATNDAQGMLKSAKRMISGAVNKRMIILSEAQHEADLTKEKAQQEAEHIITGVRSQADNQAAIVMDGAVCEGNRIIADARKEEKRIIEEAKVEAEKIVFAKLYSAEKEQTIAKNAMKEVANERERIESSKRKLEALERKNRHESRRNINERKVIGITNSQARKAQEEAENMAKTTEKIKSDAKAQASKMIEDARIMKKKAEKAEADIREREKQIEGIKAVAKAEAEKIIKDAEKIKAETEIEAKRTATRLIEKARSDADGERELIKKDIGIAMRLDREKKEKEILRSIGDLAKNEADQIVAQARRKAEEFENQMKTLKQKTEEDCMTETKKVEELLFSMREKENVVKEEAIRMIREVKAEAEEMKRVAREAMDMVPLTGDVLGNALPITPESFVKMFLEDDATGLQLSAEEFGKQLENSRKKVTLGQLVAHNPEGAKDFLEKCKREERLVHEVDLYVDRRDGRLKYKKERRLIPFTKESKEIKGG